MYKHPTYKHQIPHIHTGHSHHASSHNAHPDKTQLSHLGMVRRCPCRRRYQHHRIHTPGHQLGHEARQKSPAGGLLVDHVRRDTGEHAR